MKKLILIICFFVGCFVGALSETVCFSYGNYLPGFYVHSTNAAKNYVQINIADKDQAKWKIVKTEKLIDVVALIYFAKKQNDTKDGF